MIEQTYGPVMKMPPEYAGIGAVFVNPGAETSRTTVYRTTVLSVPRTALRPAPIGTA